MIINGHAYFRGAVFNTGASFYTSTIGGRFETDGAQFNDKKTGAVFNQLKADGVGFAGTSFKGPIYLREMTYQHISSGKPEELLEMLDRSRYDSGAYAELEQYYQKQGNPNRANEVYVKQRRRQRQELSLGPQWLWNIALDQGIRYGREPERILFWSAVVVLLGCLIFRKRLMEAQKPEADSRPYSAFLYSLDLFLPIVDLHAANLWMPKSSYGWVRRYLPVHVIAGWILITIFIGGLSGILK